MRIVISDNDRTRLFQVKLGQLRQCSSLMSDIMEHSSVVGDEFTLYRDPTVYTAIFDFVRLGDFTFESYNELRRIRLEAEYLCFDALISRTKTKLSALTVNANGTVITVLRQTAYPLLRDAFDVNECPLDDSARPLITMHCDVFALLNLLLDPTTKTTVKYKHMWDNRWRFQELRCLVLDGCAPFAPWNDLYKFLTNYRDHLKVWDDALYTFINTPMLFAFDPTLCMPLGDFKAMYHDFRQANEFDPDYKWTREHYDHVFQDMGICIRRDTRMYDGVTRSESFVMGMDVSTH